MRFFKIFGIFVDFRSLFDMDTVQVTLIVPYDNIEAKLRTDEGISAAIQCFPIEEVLNCRFRIKTTLLPNKKA